MKLYAQHGFGPGDKLTTGLAAGLIDGVVIGAKDTSTSQIGTLIAGLQQAKPDADILFDCHYYALTLPRDGEHRHGKLSGYPYWGTAPRNDLYFLIQDNIRRDLRECLEYQNTLPVSAFIAPNIVVQRTLNSREGVAATTFINETAGVARSVNPEKRVLATLALSRESILDTNELQRFVHLITSLPNPPDGFYILLALAGPLNSELFHADVISNLLFLVSSLKLNGFEVVIGYSDLVGPILASVGADAGCSGWFTTLRMFSLNRFEPSAGGGKPPRPKYFSYRLFNRIFVSELLPAFILEPSVRNGFPTDAPYFAHGEVTEPGNKGAECLQSWETLRRLQDLFGTGTRRQRFNNLTTHLRDAYALYESLRRQGLAFESSSSESHLTPLLQGIGHFQRP